MEVVVDNSTYALYGNNPIPLPNLLAVNVGQKNADVVTGAGGLKGFIKGFDASDG